MGTIPNEPAAMQGERARISPPPADIPVDYLVGDWVASFSGFIHNFPRHPRSGEIPQLPAFFDSATAVATQPKLTPTNGYFPCSNMVGLRLGPIEETTRLGEFGGEVTVHSAGRVITERCWGTYRLSVLTSGLAGGSFRLTLKQTQGAGDLITQNSRFLVRTRDELHFIMLSSTRIPDGAPESERKPSRPTMAHGVLHRMDYGALPRDIP
jgi:hypothetical protein